MKDDPGKKAVDRRFVSQQPHEQGYQRRKKNSEKSSNRRESGNLKMTNK